MVENQSDTIESYHGKLCVCGEIIDAHSNQDTSRQVGQDVYEKILCLVFGHCHIPPHIFYLASV